jgi:hypothetical protein
MRSLIWVVGTTLLFSGCGGRIGLVALPQIGKIAENAVVDTSGGITVVARAGMWTDPPVAEIIPLELTIENDSSVPVRIRHADFVFVTRAGRVVAFAPPFEGAATAVPPIALGHRALSEGVLQPGEEVKGFVYFSVFDDAEDVEFVATFVEPSTDVVVATTTMFFEAD